MVTNINFIKITLFFILPILLQSAIYAQDSVASDTIQVVKVEVSDKPVVENIKYNIEGDTIKATYDLIAPDAEKGFEISVIVMLSRDTLFSYTPTSIFGDIGKGINPGRGKKIIWEYKTDIDDPIAIDEIQFIITVQKYMERSTSGFLYYMLGGILFTGGVVTYFIIQNDKKEQVGFPHPPGRPD